MKRYFLVPLLFLAACRPSTLSEWRVEGISIVRDLVEELEGISSLEEVEAKKGSLKKKYNALVYVMMEASSYEEEEGEIVPDSFYSDALRQQYLRLYEIEGGRAALFEIQRESLHDLDKFLKKSRKG